MANRYKCKYSENLSDELWCKKACSYCTGYQYDNCIERLKSENAELKNILSKSLECMNENNNLTTGRCYSCKNGTGECESGGCVQCENWEWEYKRQAEQILKGGAEKCKL